MNRQRIHVGAQADAAGAVVLALDQRDNAGFGDAGVDLVNAIFLEFIRHDGGSALFLKANFRMGVQIFEDRCQLVGACGDDGGEWPWCCVLELPQLSGRAAKNMRLGNRLVDTRPRPAFILHDVCPVANRHAHVPWFKIYRIGEIAKVRAGVLHQGAFALCSARKELCNRAAQDAAGSKLARAICPN